MRIDRSPIRLAVSFPRLGLRCWRIDFGPLRVEVVSRTPDEARILGSVEVGRGYRLKAGADALDLIERRILEAVAGLSAHQRIAMIRDGLLIPELSHPGA